MHIQPIGGCVAIYTAKYAFGGNACFDNIVVLLCLGFCLIKFVKKIEIKGIILGFNPIGPLV